MMKLGKYTEFEYQGIPGRRIGGTVEDIIRDKFDLVASVRITEVEQGKDEWLIGKKITITYHVSK